MPITKSLFLGDSINKHDKSSNTQQTEDLKSRYDNMIFNRSTCLPHANFQTKCQNKNYLFLNYLFLGTNCHNKGMTIKQMQ